MSLQRPSPLAALSQAANRSVPPALQPAAESMVQHCLVPVRGFAFWAAILLPLTYLPVLFGASGEAFGVASGQPQVLLALLVLNVLAFLVGHDHRQPDGA